MKACVLHQINDLRYEEAPMPILQKGQVLLKIKASGICGSDLARVYTKGTYHFPTIPGHEFAGEIIEVAEECNSFLIGQNAAIFPLIPCEKCSSCQIGEYAQCKDYNYYGSRCDGGFAEYIAVNGFNLVLLPENLPLEEAAMCEPTAVAIHALSQAVIHLGDTVTIFGAGTIGIILAKLAKLQGAGKIILVDIEERKLDFARKLGFTDCINSRNVDVIEEISRITDKKGSTVTIEGTGVSVALANCLKGAATFGQVVCMGNPAKEMNIDQKSYWEILRKQLTLKGTWNSSYSDKQNDWKTAISLMPILHLGELITHRYDFSQCNEAFETMHNPEEFTVKVMFCNGLQEKGKKEKRRNNDESISL